MNYNTFGNLPDRIKSSVVVVGAGVVVVVEVVEGVVVVVGLVVVVVVVVVVEVLSVVISVIGESVGTGGGTVIGRTEHVTILNIKKGQPFRFPFPLPGPLGLHSPM